MDLGHGSVECVGGAVSDQLEGVGEAGARVIDGLQEEAAAVMGHRVDRLVLDAEQENSWTLDRVNAMHLGPLPPKVS